VARIAGVNIPTNKRVIVALTYIPLVSAAKAQGSPTSWGSTQPPGAGPDRPGVLHIR
jgi:hypothetical protein